MSLSLDKSSWKRVAFGDVIENVTDRVDDPSKAGVDRYVGLEHLNPGVLTVERWDSPDKVEAQKLRFHPGDVIFGRRRAYQKKVARADFEGICSAHALVLRAKPEAIDPDFLPVFLASDYFLERAISISVGSLSPTVNWRDLKVEEFDLPPVEEQKRIADLMWAAQNAAAKTRFVCAGLVAARTSWLDHQVHQALERQVVPFSEIWSRSPEGGWSAQPVDDATGRFVLSLAALGPQGYKPGQLKSVMPAPEVEAKKLSHGDLLISRANTVDMVGRAAIFSEDRSDVSFPDTMMRLHLSPAVSPIFALAVLMSGHGRKHMRRTAAGSATSMVKINRKSLGELVFPVLSREEQRAITDQLEVFDRALTDQETESDQLRRMKSALEQMMFRDAS